MENLKAKIENAKANISKWDNDELLFAWVRQVDSLDFDDDWAITLYEVMYKEIEKRMNKVSNKQEK